MQQKHVKRFDHILGIVMLILTAMVIFGIIFCNFFMENDKDYFGSVTAFSDGWTDGNGNAVLVPSTIADAGQSVTIYNTLPEIIHSETLCIRSSQQDITISIDGQVRQYYSTKESSLFKQNSASRYVFAALDPTDSGKEISITIETTSMYKGRINDILLGGSASLLLSEFSQFMSSDVSAVFMLFLGIIGLGFGIFSMAQYKLETPIFELGWLATIAGLWELSESRMRQFYFNNNSAMSNIAFILLGLLPIFILRFVNVVFKKRYEKLFVILQTVCIFVFGVEFLLFGLGIFDLAESMPFTVVECAVMLAIIFGLLINEIRTKRAKEYKLTAIGLFIFEIGAVFEIIYISHTWVSQRIMFFCAMILFFLTGIQEIRGIVERSTAEHIEQKKHAEALSLQVVTALSATVDAKDPYTNGHSNRVAEYSREIAKRYGMTDQDLKEVYYAGLLHDIGKISIPDTIINKTSGLTDEEYAAIKKHPVAGAEILKKVTEMPNLQIGARWHHERFDGKGYPDGLKGEEIPLWARIIAVADSYDAMASYRSYRDALPQQKVYEEIEKGKGSQFDPKIADILLTMIKEDKDYKMCEKAPKMDT